MRTYRMIRQSQPVGAMTAHLVREASAPYRDDWGAYYRARGKLGADPAFAAILREGLLRDAERILDLGCGQGLLASWLVAARRRHAAGGALMPGWPSDWPAAPRLSSFRGIELNRRAVDRARNALGPCAEFERDDIVCAEFGTADAIVILDVLHYIEYRSQLSVLDRARAALVPGGVLLLRISDAAGGVRFVIGKCLDQAVLLASGLKPAKIYCRSVREWYGVLAAIGFQTEALPMSSRTPFANIMLIARPR